MRNCAFDATSSRASIFGTLTVALIAVFAVGCGGTMRTSAAAISHRHVNALRVKHSLENRIDAIVSFDPDREDGAVSVLTPDDESYGSFNVWVFKPGRDPMNYLIGKVHVPKPGRLSWGKWTPTDPELLPGDGSYTVLKNYGNVVIDYAVDAKKHRTPTKMPGGFILIDGALASLTHTRTTTEPLNAPRSRWVFPNEFDASAVHEILHDTHSNPRYLREMTLKARRDLLLIRKYASQGVPAASLSTVYGAIEEVQYEMVTIDDGKSPSTLASGSSSTTAPARPKPTASESGRRCTKTDAIYTSNDMYGSGVITICTRRDGSETCDADGLGAIGDTKGPAWPPECAKALKQVRSK